MCGFALYPMGVQKWRTGLPSEGPKAESEIEMKITGASPPVTLEGGGWLALPGRGKGLA